MKKEILLRRRCGVFIRLIYFVFSAPIVRSLSNAVSNSDISASENMLKNLEWPQRRALRVTESGKVQEIIIKKKPRKTVVSVSIC